MVNFILNTPDTGIIASTATHHVNLEAIKSEFGNNFNTLLLINNSTEELRISLDGRVTAHVRGSGGMLGIDWEDGIIYSDIQITNMDGANDTSANEIRLSVGRTGVN